MENKETYTFIDKICCNKSVMKGLLNYLRFNAIQQQIQF